MSYRGATISPLAYVAEGAEIGEGSNVEAGAWISAGARIGRNCKIESGACVGYGYSPGQNELTVVGDESLISTGAVVYHTVKLGRAAKIRHNATVREHVVIGEGTNIGSGSNVEHHSTIGRFCSLHTHVHITDYSTLGDYIFIGPHFASFSDIVLDYRRPQLHQPYQGIRIGSKARIGGRVTMLPGSVVGEETVVGACSMVQGELHERMVYLGSPARAVRRVSKEQELSKFD